MRWLVTGANGMFGTDLCDVLTVYGQEVSGIGSADCDIRDLNALRAVVRGYDVVVNTAAWTAVDDAEANESAAFAVNAVGARNVALAARESGARTVQISTDYVFDGSATTPYVADHPQAPCSAYGRTKAAGEWAVRLADPDSMVVRTAWLYGHHGPNFVKTVVRLGAERETISVVDDQTGQPTWTRDLAEFIVALINAEVPGGFYHGTSAGEVTRYDLARAVFEFAGMDPERVIPGKTADFPFPAPRPAYSVLDHAAGLPSMPTWHVALQRYFAPDQATIRTAGLIPT